MAWAAVSSTSGGAVAEVARSMSSDQRSRSSWASSPNPMRSAITINGSGAATSHTKSQVPASHTRSTMRRHSPATVSSISAMRRGVKPRFTSERRRWWSGLSIEIIIGSGVPWGRGARRLENVFGSFSMARTSS